MDDHWSVDQYLLALLGMFEVIHNDLVVREFFETILEVSALFPLSVYDCTHQLDNVKDQGSFYHNPSSSS